MLLRSKREVSNASCDMIKSSLFKSRGVRESGGTERVVVSWLGPRVNIVSAAVRCFYRGDTVLVVVDWLARTPAV